VLGPIGVRGSDGIDPEARRHRSQRLVITEVEHQQRFGIRRRSVMLAARGELQMRAGAGHLQEDAVVAVVVPTIRHGELRARDAVVHGPEV
jgi:cytochrome c-type biogenesis protein CcmH/NrfG